MDDMGEGMGDWGLGGMMGMGGWMARGDMGEWNADRRDRWGWVVRNSFPMDRSSSRVRELLSFQVRDSGSRVRGGSSLSLSEGKKLDAD